MHAYEYQKMTGMALVVFFPPSFCRLCNPSVSISLLSKLIVLKSFSFQFTCRVLCLSHVNCIVWIERSFFFVRAEVIGQHSLLT